MAWRAADSLSLRQFLDIALHEASPDHSTVSRTRRRIDLETHQAVFTWVLQRLADAGLVRGTTVGIDATTLEANATLRSIVRRDTQEGYEPFLRGLAEASGMSTPTRAELARFDRKRSKMGSNDECTHRAGPGREDHQNEGRAHASGPQGRARGGSGDRRRRRRYSAGCRRRRHPDDSSRRWSTPANRSKRSLPVGSRVMAEVIGDRGYHSNATLLALAELGNPQLRVGAVPRSAPLAGQARGPRGCHIRESATHSRYACGPAPATAAR